MPLIPSYTTLKELKIGLSRVQTKRIKIDLLPKEEIDERVTEIKQILDKNGIAFLDVMDKAIRKKPTRTAHSWITANITGIATIYVAKVR